MNMTTSRNKVSVIGPAIVDILAGPVDRGIFDRKSNITENIRQSYGGNALNEAVVLSRLGDDVELISKVGNDEPGKHILEFLHENGVGIENISVEDDLKTATNIVLVDHTGERFFLTDPNTNLRKLSLQDIEKHIADMGDIVCFPCMFTSPLLGIMEMTKLFKCIKEAGNRTIVLDMTTPKNNENINEMFELFSYIDYFLPNEEELESLSNNMDVIDSAKQIVSYGVKAVIVKRGSRDTLIVTENDTANVPTFKPERIADTTGAGDCFGAGFIHGLSTGKALYDSVLFGNAVASCSVEEYGATDGVMSEESVLKRLSYYSIGNG